MVSGDFGGRPRAPSWLKWVLGGELAVLICGRADASSLSQVFELRGLASTSVAYVDRQGDVQ